ncbi:MAG: reverse transcriptase domain-containing protein [Hyphomicrobiaceae bacterium]
MPLASPETVPALALDGRALETSTDVARFFGLPPGRLIYALYKAPAVERYRHFEIPKRTGGMRLISAPRGIVRDCQETLAPRLQAIHDAHPSAHGFIREKSVVTNASGHVGRHWVLNIDLADFFPTINFGRVRGLFMAPPFRMGAKAATVMAQICTYRNGLPQGAPTSPALSNFIAAALDRRLTRLAKEQRCRYSRYADDITFSSDQPVFPPALAVLDVAAPPERQVQVGPALDEAIRLCGFSVNAKKVRLQGRHRHQSVTGLAVNRTVNVARTRIRRIRAMLHAWEKHGIEAAAAEHFTKYGRTPQGGLPERPAAAFRNVVYGQLAFVKMVRGQTDPVFLKLCARLIDLDPNPSRFVRQMVFGADDFEIFISHASEDKVAIARPIFEACERYGLKAFLDEEHIGWGQSFTKKINTALGAARTIVVIVSSNSVTKDWPLTEMNTALGMEASGSKTVVPVMVGKPDLTKLPLIRGKRWIDWTGDAMAVAKILKDAVKPTVAEPMPAVPELPDLALDRDASGTTKPSLLSRIFGS